MSDVSDVSDEGGSATVLSAVMIVVLLTVFGAGLGVGTAIVGRHRAQAVADLAALTAAERLPSGATSACEQAMLISRRMVDAQVGCRVDHLDVVVTVDLPVAFGGRRIGVAHAASRAGPKAPAG